MARHVWIAIAEMDGAGGRVAHQFQLQSLRRQYDVLKFQIVDALWCLLEMKQTQRDIARPIRLRHARQYRLRGKMPLQPMQILRDLQNQLDSIIRLLRME